MILVYKYIGEIIKSGVNNLEANMKSTFLHLIKVFALRISLSVLFFIGFSYSQICDTCHIYINQNALRCANITVKCTPFCGHEEKPYLANSQIEGASYRSREKRTQAL